MEVVKDVGLITCERVVYRHGAILHIVRECSGFNPRRFRRHGKKTKQEQTTNAQTCDDMCMMDARCDTLSHNVMCAQRQSVREKVSCEVYLSTTPVGYNG